MRLTGRAKTDEREEAMAQVNALLQEAVAAGASDLHLEPLATGYEVRHRVDGLLSTVGRLERSAGEVRVNQLMVAAKLLTYRRSSPQEGRIRATLPGDEPQVLDLRLAIMPTTHGPRAVVRLPAELYQPRSLDGLGLPKAVLDGLETFVRASGGMLILCGPAGSGKTTTTYALLDAIVAHQPGVSVISLEDPVERDLPRVTQIEIQPFGELTFEKTLRSVLRQDPQVLAVGEIRDRETAKIAVQAALSGHRLVTTLHASSPEAALVRLIEMGVEPYQVASAVTGVASLRLVRRGSETEGYAGRLPIGEFAAVDEAVRRVLLDQPDRSALRQAMAEQAGFVDLQGSGQALVDAGKTDESELCRVIGQAG